MQVNAAHVLQLVLDAEAGYQDDHDDPGNWTGARVGAGTLAGTNHGITPRTLAAARGVAAESITAADMRALSQVEAEGILRAQYLTPIRFDVLPDGLDYAAADCCVNSGPAQAVRLLQGVLGVEADGIAGLHTLAALKGREAVDLIHAYSQARMSFLRRLPTWATYGRGWATRVARVESEAVEMATGIEHAHPELADGAHRKAPPASPAKPPPRWLALLSLFTRRSA